MSCLAFGSVLLGWSACLSLTRGPSFTAPPNAAAHAAALDERYEIRRHAAEATAAAAHGLRAGASWLKATFGAERSLPAPPAVAVPEGVFDETGEEVFVPPPRAPPAAPPAVAVPQDLFDESGEEVVALPPRGLAPARREPCGGCNRGRQSSCRLADDMSRSVFADRQ